MTTALAYSPYAYEIHEDPYPTYARLRDEAPVYRNDEFRFWALSRHADVTAAFRDATRYSSADGVSLDPSATGRHASRTMSFLAMDDPVHGRMRALISKVFTPRRVVDLEPYIRERVAHYLTPALADGGFDFIEDFAGRLPMDVISEMIGVPQADRDQARRLATLLVHREEGLNDVPPAGMAAALELVSYFLELIAQRRAAPRHDLTSALLAAEIDGEHVSEEDLVAFLVLMVVAGNETTTKLLGNAWYWAWRHPEQRAKGYDDVHHWVEETLRFDTPTQMLARTAAQPIELHGERIEPGDRVLLLIGSANRDPRVFEDAEHYDLDRDTSELVSFGFGRHFCLGAPLARLEATIALKELARTIESYEIDPAKTVRVHSVNVRGFAALPTDIKVKTHA